MRGEQRKTALQGGQVDCLRLQLRNASCMARAPKPPDFGIATGSMLAFQPHRCSQAHCDQELRAAPPVQIEARITYRTDAAG